MPSVGVHSFFLYFSLILRCLFLVTYTLLSIFYMYPSCLLVIKLYWCLILKSCIGGNIYTIILVLKSVTFPLNFHGLLIVLWLICFHCRNRSSFTEWWVVGAPEEEQLVLLESGNDPRQLLGRSSWVSFEGPTINMTPPVPMWLLISGWVPQESYSEMEIWVKKF